MSIQIIEAGPQVFYVAITLLISSFGLSPQPLISIKVVKPWKLSQFALQSTCIIIGNCSKGHPKEFLLYIILAFTNHPLVHHQDH